MKNIIKTSTSTTNQVVLNIYNMSTYLKVVFHVIRKKLSYYIIKGLADCYSEE